MQSIPPALYEAARVDGANAWYRFWHVTLPGLAPVVLLVSVLTMAGYLQLFAEPYVMTQGGPGQSTVSVLYFMYEQGFKWWNLGTASAVAFAVTSGVADSFAAQGLHERARESLRDAAHPSTGGRAIILIRIALQPAAAFRAAAALVVRVEHGPATGELLRDFHGQRRR